MKNFEGEDPMIDSTEKLIREIKERARIYTLDNFKNPSKYDFLLVENAMLIGSSIGIEFECQEIK